MNRFQPPGRAQLYALARKAWQQGLILSSGNIHPETFVSEMDQLSTHYKVSIEIKRFNGKAYCLANEGIPIPHDPQSLQATHYKQTNPNYKITQAAWQQLTQTRDL